MATAGSSREDLIKLYFDLGIPYKGILEVLAAKHQIILSERHLKRILSSRSLSRRKEYSDLGDLILFIQKTINEFGNLHGYRWMHAKCLQHGLSVRKEDVRMILSALDSEGVQVRQSRRLQRRSYFAKGPNYIWHLDSYDKLKPFGFCINGCIDGFSRKLLWLNVYTTNNDPKVIGSYFMEAVCQLKGCPVKVRGDKGTENVFVKKFQRLLRRSADGEMNMNSYLEGVSTANQRIESFWAQLRKQCIEFWLDLFYNIRNDGYFDGDFIDRNILQFCFMGMIQVIKAFRL